MNGIYFKEGVYTIIDTNIENNICIYDSFHKDNVLLYGGRVKIERDDRESATLSVDGIAIVNIVNIKIENSLSLNTIISHLNAIETYGVDAFLENYKKSVEFLYSEVKELHNVTEAQIFSEHDNSKLQILLDDFAKIKKLLFSVLAILFSLLSYMNAGLENEKVVSVCQSIIDSFA